MELIQATARETDELLAFYQHVADNMEEKGLQHWHWGRYPTEEMIRADIEKGDLYYMREGELMAAAVVFMVGQEPEYDSLSWTWGVKPGIFHRLAVHPSLQGAGMILTKTNPQGRAIHAQEDDHNHYPSRICIA